MNTFVVLHLLGTIPCLLMGPIIFLKKKGDANHKLMGKIWALLMVYSSLVSFGIKGESKNQWLYGLAVLNLICVGLAIRAIKLKDVRGHQRNMILSYFFSLVALVFAVRPDRLIGSFIERFVNQ